MFYRFLSTILAVLLLSIPMNMYALAFDLGPFSFRLGNDVHFESFRDPVCHAIADRNLLVLFIDTKEGEKPERVILEPYTFGYNKDRELMLYGYHIEKVDFEIEESEEEKKGRGMIGGVFSTFSSETGWQELDFKNVRGVRVLKHTDFSVREEGLKNLDDKNKIVEPICSY